MAFTAGRRWEQGSGSQLRLVLESPLAVPAGCSRWGTGGLARHLQVEVLLPHRIQVPIDGFRPFLGLPDLDSDIRVTGPCLVLCLQALGTDHWKTHRTDINVCSRKEAC